MTAVCNLLPILPEHGSRLIGTTHLWSKLHAYRPAPHVAKSSNLEIEHRSNLVNYIVVMPKRVIENICILLHHRLMQNPSAIYIL